VYISISAVALLMQERIVVSTMRTMDASTADATD
jgi:hypothetical protein